MSTHNICFCGAIRRILCGYPLLSGAMNMKPYQTTIIIMIWVYQMLMISTVARCLCVWRNKENLSGVLSLNTEKIRLHSSR